MRKVLAILLAAAMVLGLAACGGSSEPAQSGSSEAAGSSCYQESLVFKNTHIIILN